jgi:pyruvate dehydrogenase E2 component (dihydrolipoamide acetyltransferase)
VAYVFELPEIGEGVVEGEIVEFLVTEGASVAKNAPFCSVMTDKATVEISSPVSGRVAKLFGKPGDIIKVHTPIAEIEEGAAAAPAAAAPAPKPAPAAPAPKATPAAGYPSAALPAPAPPTRAAPPPTAAALQGPTVAAPPKAPPAVRRRAHEEGIDLGNVAGTGPGGRITHEDLDQAHLPVLAKAPPALPQVLPSGAETRVPIVGLRRKIAEQMVKSKHTAAHFTYVEEVDGTALVAMRERLKRAAEARGAKLTYLPFVLKACSVAFRDFPNVNAVMDEERFELVVKGDHHLGVSIDTPNGLFVGVLRNVEQKSILHLAVELDGLVERVRSGKASRDDLVGSTFTVTSVGNIGGILATPVLNHPEVAILGFNAIRKRPMVVGDQIVVRSMFNLSPSFDHRIIDGAVGARFTARLKEILETPESLLLDLA